MQKEVLDLVKKTLPKMNEIKKKTFKKKKEVDEKAKLTLFSMPTKAKANVSYSFLESFFKCSNNPDYRSLPGQVNQQVMKLVFQDWKSFFAANRDYQKHPEKYLGKPKMPRYKKQEKMVCVLTNQISKILNSSLRFPLTNERLELGKIANIGKLQQVRILPYGEDFVVEVVMKSAVFGKSIIRNEDEDPNKLVHPPRRIMNLDMGVNVLAAVTDNTGLPPILINGKPLKAINQWYNKQMSFYISALRNGKDPKEGPFTSKKIQEITFKRNRRVEDFLHKASASLVSIAVEREIDTLVIGRNALWKQEIEMKKKDKQNFIAIPFSKFISMIKYKAEREGIQVVTTEESYTSKASLLSMDNIPVYKEGNTTKYHFSGYRKTRSFYRDKILKIEWHADLNGSGNIGRKLFPNMFSGIDLKSLLQTPIVVKINHVKRRVKAQRIEVQPVSAP